MGLIDLFLNRKKKSFNIKRNGNQFSEEEIIKILEDYDEATLNMFQAIRKYNKVKNELIERGTFTDVELSQTEILSIVNEFFKNTIDNLPVGIIIPIETSLKIDGRAKSLLIGRDLMCVGKYYSQTTDKSKRGLTKQHEVAILIDSDKIPDHNDFTSNIRISVKPSDRIINLSSEEFLPNKWSVCRFSTIELNFDECNDSRNQIDDLQDITVASQVLKAIPVIDIEITGSIDRFLNKKQAYLSNTLTNSMTSIAPTEDKSDTKLEGKNSNTLEHDSDKKEDTLNDTHIIED